MAQGTLRGIIIIMCLAHDASPSLGSLLSQKLRELDFTVTQYTNTQPGVKQAQALADISDISRSALCCRSNETRASIANPPNSPQLEGTAYHSPKSHPGPCSSVGMRRGTDRHTDGRDQYTFRLGYASREM